MSLRASFRVSHLQVSISDSLQLLAFLLTLLFFPSIVLLGLLFGLLPKILRPIIRLQGYTRESDVELELFSRFWLFQVIHGFLIVSLASGLSDALSNIAETLPTLPTEIAKKLPSASTFFMQWLALYALASFGASVARPLPWLKQKLTSIRYVARTPRKTFDFTNKMVRIQLAEV